MGHYHDFVRGEIDHYNPVPKIKEDIRKGLGQGEAENEREKRRLGVLRKLAPTWAAFEELREKYPTLVLDYCNLKNSKYAKGELPQKISADQMVALMGEVTGENAAAIFKKHSTASVSSTPRGKISVPEKLSQCDFLLNKDFKKNAKFYLCLFSASWCPPCRAEMPRIAKTYAETLKNDPDIELIHFSRDQNDEKALAWAKEHDVKFPVVKPNGGNPLDLHSRGIPHLFIVKADGTLVEEGHPMKVFTEERISRIKENRPLQDKVTTNGVNWVYEVKDDGIILGGGNRNKKAVEKSTSGSVEIPDSIMGRPVRGIGEWAFSDCRGIKSVVIPPSVSRIGGRAFIWSGLNSVTIPANIKSVGCAAFHGCSDLKAVTIQPGVEQLESTAFMWCSSLESVSIPASVTSIGKEAFSYCERLLSFSVDPDNPSYSSNDKMLCTKDGSTLVAGVNGDVTIPPCVSSVGPSAFYGCISLKSVKIPLNVKSIGKYAFFACRELKSVAIPSSVTSIGERAFCWCDRLMGFEVDYDNAFYTAEGDVLYNKMKTELIFWPTGKSGLVTMPPSVTDIRGWAFSHCKGVASVTIPSSVKNIGELAFDGCSALISVTMCGERPESHGDVFRSCEKLKSIHVPANAKSWAGMKEWQGIPLVFDAESQK